MNDLEKKRKEVEYKRISMGVDERDLKIMERLAEIERLKEDNEKAQRRMDALKEELDQ